MFRSGFYRAREAKLRLVSILGVAIVLGVHSPAKALAMDPAQVFQRWSWVVSGEGAIGQVDNDRLSGNLQIFNLGARVSLLPFATVGGGAFYYGSLETGLEPFFQRYRFQNQNLGGIALALRYHFLGLGRIVPYVEGLAGPAGTDLKIPGLHSNFTFFLNVGFGAEYFVTDRIAPYIGFRLEHVSNAELQPPDLGFQAYTALIGVSFLLPK